MLGVRMPGIQPTRALQVFRRPLDRRSGCGLAVTEHGVTLLPILGCRHDIARFFCLRRPTLVFNHIAPEACPSSALGCQASFSHTRAAVSPSLPQVVSFKGTLWLNDCKFRRSLNTTPVARMGDAPLDDTCLGE
jgi:hypothetical protein